MILLKPSFEILNITRDPLRLIERAGRVCYRSEDKIADGSAEKFCRMLIKNGHESVLEHAHATVEIVTSRDVTHQMVRHRLISPSQESQRYCDYSGHVRFIIPEWATIEPDEMTNLNAADEYVEDAADWEWLTQVFEAETGYQRLRELGKRPEQARSVLPNCTATTIVVTANFREWRHIFRLRTDSHADAEMRRMMQPLLAEMQNLVPVVFDDIGGDHGTE
jgi:thymidylate synthase (FAD)